jgi:hypothetical protein
MSDPITEKCAYCGSPDVIDDAWWCSRHECWNAYYKECERGIEYERRTPLTYGKARNDLGDTKASVWGPPSRVIEDAAEAIARLANLPIH